MSFKPKTEGSSGGQAHKRPSDANQQIAKSIRPQLPRDGSAGGINSTLRGKMPAGFVSVFDFSDNANTKMSPTSRPGNAGKKDIY